jgi:signal transduction histidine kinase/HPt (histidine-containing phosphotransfer) domain-containing protein/ActR/RegA family two-component response regulator
MAAFLQEVLSRIGYVFFEHAGNGQFRLLSPVPPWLTALWGISWKENSAAPIAENSPFLEHFLSEAGAILGRDASATCRSEVWIERSSSGKEIPLQALAVQVEGKRYLALQSPEAQFKERSQLLQTARDSHLEHEKLLREIQKKEILLHCIIHDLSQPLSVMSVTLDCLADERVSERAKHLLELGKLASDQQLSMIRDILRVFSEDLKAAQDGEKGNLVAADLLECANKVIEAYLPVFAAKGVRLALRDPGEPEANWQVRGEDTRLHRVFSNLIENALRYAPSGSSVTIGLEREGESLKAVVDDEGPGLPPDLSTAQIFSLFAKGKGGGGKAGLGLYSCRLTVERWGGSIGCESRAGRGARFWFRLPLAATRPERAAVQPADATAPGGKTVTLGKGPMRILLADDQKEIRLLTTHQLERGGHHVVAVADGKQALEAVERESFDVILMDEQMPVMNGTDALAAIRKREKEHGHTVVIALTGYNTDPDRERLMNVGFDGVIGKPFRLDALAAMLHSSVDSVASATPPPEQSAIGAGPGAGADLLQRVGGDAKLLRQMIRTFLHDTPKRMDGIYKAIRAKRGEHLASCAHALKGSVSIFGAEQARQHCQELQQFGRNSDFAEAAKTFPLLKEEIAEVQASLRGYAGQRSSPRKQSGSRKPRRSPTGKKRR